MRRSSLLMTSLTPDDGKDEIIAIIGLVAVTALLTIGFLVLSYTTSQPSPKPPSQPAAAARLLR